MIILVFYIISWTLLNKAGVQGSTDGTIGTNGNANGTIGSSNGTLGKPVLPLVSQWCHWKANGKPMVPLTTNCTIGKNTNDTIWRTPNHKLDFYFLFRQLKWMDSTGLRPINVIFFEFLPILFSNEK